MTPALSVDARGVRVRHHDAERWTPAGVDLAVSAGEAVLVLGPSGCGKSTFSLTLNGLVPHSLPATVEGDCTVAGLDTAVSPPNVLAGTVGIVFQDPDAQLVTSRVHDEVCFALENLLLPTAEIERRAADALAQVGLTGRADVDPGRLSGGERQRLAVACALAMEPRVLVLDEPTANLDPVASRDLYRLLGELIGRDGRSLVVVEHDLDDVIGLVDSVVVLDRSGRTVLTGEPRTVFAEHAETLEDLGVWRPTAVTVARRLAAAGTPLTPLPLTVAEAGACLAEQWPTEATAPTPKPRAEPPGGTAVRVHGLTVTLSRGSPPALDDITMEVPEGDFTAIVGSNGAGKTTLAQAIAGVRTPPRDVVQVGGLDVGSASPRRLAATVGFVFQNPEHQFVAPTVAAELGYGLRVRKTPEPDVEVAVERALTRFGLTEYAGTNPFLLSHGEKRRLSVATALVTGPGVLVLDEPTFGQDRTYADELMALLAELNEQGTTVLVVTHDLQLVAEHADSVVLLQDGRLLAHAPCADVLTDSALLRSAGLLPPPVRRIAEAVPHPSWRRAFRLADLPGPPQPAERLG